LDGEVGHTLEVKGTLVKNNLVKNNNNNDAPSKKRTRNSDENGDVKDVDAKAGDVKGSLRVANVTEDVHRLGDRCSTR
jgi:hypothetical protein